VKYRHLPNLARLKMRASEARDAADCKNEPP
jgi:hypothetical protein